MPEMQRMVEAMMRSLRGIAAISWLLCIVVYVYSVMGTILLETEEIMAKPILET